MLASSMSSLVLLHQQYMKASPWIPDSHCSSSMHQAPRPFHHRLYMWSGGTLLLLCCGQLPHAVQEWNFTFGERKFNTWHLCIRKNSLCSTCPCWCKLVHHFQKSGALSPAPTPFLAEAALRLPGNPWRLLPHALQGCPAEEILLTFVLRQLKLPMLPWHERQ